MARPRFDVDVPQNGYRWWYVDATSDDGKNALTIIGFVGSVFSPYYRRARSKGETSPENHCAINVALYGTKRRWAMTEHGSGHVERDAEHFHVGHSSMTWNDKGLEIEINERCMPLPFALRGRMRVTVDQLYDRPVMLDENGKHFWQAVAPQARVDVEFENPKLAWSGAAYHDMNWGEEPLERGFKNWTWARANTECGTQVLYDLERRDKSKMSFGRCFENGNVSDRKVPVKHELPRGLWGMRRKVNSETAPLLISTLEDAPFYTRNLVRIGLNGVPCVAIHESLALDRFTHPIVQMMLPFRMPRVR